MKKVIAGNRIIFYDDSNNELMYIDHSTDDCVWWFNIDSIITITENMELYDGLKYLMNQDYEFSNSDVLKDYKTDNLLIWNSDCYYNPDDEWSIKYVSHLIIEYVDNIFKIRCVKPIDAILNRQQKTHCIVFSPCGNGRYAKNKTTGSTLQDDFVIRVYQKLKNVSQVKKLSKQR